MSNASQAWKLALVDLDGTLYRGTEPISGSAAFIRRLRHRGIQPVFFTNNSTRTPAQVRDKLAVFGIEAEEREVCTSSEWSASYLAGRCQAGDTVLYIGQHGLHQALEAAGFRPLAATGGHVLEGGIGAAVLGLDPEVTYAKFTDFCQVVTDLGWFVLTNGDVRLPAKDRFLPGNGALGRFVATATGVEPYTAGKPNPDFVRFALQRYGVLPAEAVVIGDNVLTDIAAGRAAGVHTIQVLSGVSYDRGLSPSWSNDGGIAPDGVAQSVAELFRE